MASNSRRYLQLEQRIKKLRNSYIPPADPNGRYSHKQRDDIRAYLLLSHAEIESYLEDISEQKAKKAYSAWQGNRQKSNVLLALATFHPGKKIEYDNLEDRIRKIVETFISQLKTNHGIKEENIKKIMLPIGLENSELDVAWLSTMNSFGSIRGEAAHQSVKVQNPLDPITLSNEVNNILLGIKDLDLKLKKLS